MTHTLFGHVVIRSNPIKNRYVLKPPLPLSSSSKKLFTSDNNHNNNINNKINDKSDAIQSNTNDKSDKKQYKHRSKFHTILSILQGTILFGSLGGFILYQNKNRKAAHIAKHQILQNLMDSIGLGLCLYLIGLNDEVMDTFNCDVNDIIITKGSIQLSKINKMGTTIKFIITNPQKSIFGEVNYFIMNVWSKSIHTNYKHSVELTVNINDEYGSKLIGVYKGSSEDIENMNPIIYPYYYYDENKERKPTKIRREIEDQVFMIFVSDE
eukprot:419043_1